MAAQEEDRTLNDDDEEAVRNDDLGYPIVIADDVRPHVTDILGDAGPIVVLADASPAVLAIARSVASRLRNVSGICSFVLGEKRKRLATVERVHEALLAVGADRQTTILGVGGGVANDLFGFAAATYMRGVPYAHVATTLVAMADASIGGKTGVDVPAGKNIAGLFRDPIAVFAHVDALQTLPYRLLREGLAEIVKASVIEGDELFSAIETLSPHPFWRWPWVAVVASAVKVKTMIVADDRHESGMRELLNLGHTFGHGIESASGYRVSHGVGVALGLRAAGMLALRIGMFSEAEHLRVLATMALLGMPLQTSLDAGDVFAAMQSDKKKRNGRLRFVLPRSIGDVEFGVEASDRDVKIVLSQLQQTPGAIG